jgi:SAM-dependent methyltransferase
MFSEVDGYTLEVDYTFEYHSSLSPTHLRLVALNQSVSFPAGQPLRYLELGCGNGVTLNVHAAACPGEYWGVDANPSHVDFASKLADASGANVRILRSSFSDLLAQSKFPKFDVIVAHGVWTWISEENQKSIVELLHRNLVEGGLFFLSYNSLPGSASIIPLQQMLWLHSRRGGHAGRIQERLAAAIRFATELREAGSKYFERAPMAADRLDGILERIKTDDTAHLYTAYLCHEYLQENWRPSSFSETASSLAKIGMRFVASADLTEHYDDLTFDAKALELLNSVKDPLLCETARDLLRNQQFRRDVYVKGGALLTEAERAEAFFHIGFALVTPTENLPDSVELGTVTINLLAAPYAEILKVLAEDSFRSKTVAELAKRISLAEIDIPMLIRALLVLTAAKLVHPAQSKWAADQTAAYCNRINREIFRRTSSTDKIKVVASPVLGGGKSLSPRLIQLFMKSKALGATSPEEWASFAWRNLSNTSARPHTNDPLRGAKILKEAVLFSRQCQLLTALGVETP